MSTYTTSMFDEIKSALTKSDTQGNAKYKDILKTIPGNIYTVRLVPNVSDPAKTFFHYYTHAWESFATGQYISAVSPQTGRDPISEARFTLSKNGSLEEKEKVSKIVRRENWLVNVYVVNDPTNPDNNGKVKMLRYGRQLNKIIKDAIEGDDADDLGPRVFDLSPNGCNFKIKVEKQGEFPTYVSSRFASPSKLMNSADPNNAVDADEVYNSITDLETVFGVKSYDQLKKVLNEHFYCREDDVEDVWNPEGGTEQDVNENSAGGGTHAEVKQKKPVAADDDPLNDDKVKELLEGLGD